MLVSKADLEFADAPVVMFWGRSGQGKSAAFDAVVLCWTGKKRSGTYLEYIKQGEQSATVDMDATIMGNPINFHVELHHKGRTPFTRQVTYGGVTYTNNEATDLIESLDVLYYFEVLTMLQGAEDVVSLSPAKRSEYMQRLFNFSFDEQIKKMKDELEALTGDKTSWSNEVSTNEALIAASKDRVEKLPKEIEGEIEKLEASVSELEQKLIEDGSGREKRDSLRAELVEATQAEMDLRKQESSTKIEIDRLTNSIKKELEKNNQKEEFERKIAEASQLLGEAMRDKEAFQGAVDSFKSSLDENEREYAEKKSNLDEIERLIRSIEEKICPHCGQQSEEHAKKLMLEKYGSTGVDVRTKFASRVADIQATMNELKKKIRENEINFAKVESKLISYEAEIKESFEKSLAISIDLGMVKEFKEEISTKEKLIDQLSEKIKTISGEIEKKRIEIDSIVVVDLAEQKAELAKTKEKLTIAKSTKERNEKTRVEEAKTTARLEKENSSLFEKIEAAVVAASIREEAISIVTKHFVNWLVVKTCDNLQQTMNEVIHEVFPNYNVKLEQSTSGVKFLYTKDDSLEKGSHNQWLDGRMSSGFERALLSVSFRVALCTLYELPIMLLDEVDQNADDDSSQALYEHIFSLGRFEQVFCISHKPKIRFLLSDQRDNAKIYLVENGRFELEE